MTLEIDVQGPRRNGTNYLKALLEKNTDAEVHRNHPTTPHVPTPHEDRHVVAIIKHPQASVVSQERYLSDHREGLETVTERHRLRAMLLEAWLSKVYRWANPAGPCNVVRYEYLLRDPSYLFNLLPVSQFNVPLEDVTERVRPSKEPGEVRTGGIAVDRDYYLKQAWRNAYTEHEWEYLQDSFETPLAQRVLEWTGYTPIPPDEVDDE